jgi:hypothetical protein
MVFVEVGLAADSIPTGVSAITEEHTFSRSMPQFSSRLLAWITG